MTAIAQTQPCCFQSYGEARSAHDAAVARANLAMDRYARGDEAAFGVMYDLVAPRLHGFVVRRTRDAAQAEDIVQQTFLQICAARDAYVTGDVLPWAFAIARRLMIDSFRKHRREIVSDAVVHEPEAGGGSCPERSLHATRAALSMRRALESLPEGQRSVFEMLKYDGLSLVEVADVLGTTVTAVKLRAHRAYKALRLAAV